MSELFIVALTGPKGAGKDTVADYLVAHHGHTKLAFADALRDEVGRAFDVSIQLLTQRETKEHPMTALALHRCMDGDFIDRIMRHHSSVGGVDMSIPRSPRQIMQWWGTEYRRANNRHYWLDAFTTRFVNAHKDGQTRFVVTDVRNANEAELLRELGASLWQITRPGFEPEPGAHSSETTGKEFHPRFTLINDRDAAALHRQTRKSLTTAFPELAIIQTGAAA